MANSMHKWLILVLSVVLLSVGQYATADSKPVPAGKKDKCPVCGMFVHKYPDWVGQIAFSDGSTVFFDGTKDLFKYYFKLDRYNPGKTAADIAAIWVTEYYDMTSVQARSAFFVVGSDVLGPMGKELIPFKTKAAAQEFMKDHHGAAILLFEQISPAVIEKLD